MSDQWETVTKNRKSKAQPNGATVAIPTNGAGGRQSAKNTVRIEDVLSRQQIQSLYAGDSAKKPAVAPAPQKKVAAKSSIPAALVPAHKQKSSGAPGKPKPKNLEAGLGALNLAEIEGLVDTYRNNFTDSHLVWLKAIIAYLNSNLNLETNPTFNGNSPRYPANIVPNRLQSLIYQTLRDAGVANIHYFFDQTLSSMADDMTKNLPVTGYKIMLQLIAIEWPTVCVKSLAKNAILRNSYQNRAPIGLTLLWALGQGGYRDLNVGLRVWQNIMMPVLEIKAYTRFVVEYVHRILHNTRSTVEVSVSSEELYRFYDELTAHRQWLGKDLQALFDESAATLLTKFVESATKVQPIFITLLKRLNEKCGGSNVVGALTGCIRKDADCLKAWRILFRKNASESNVLLRELNKPENSDLVSSKPFGDFLDEVRAILRAVPEAKITDDLKESNRLVKNSQDKSAQHKSSASKSKGCCSFFLFASFFAFLAILGVLAYDTHVHGSFTKSATGQFLERTGALPYVELAWVKTMGPVARGYKVAEPVVLVYADQACTVLHPYGVFVRDLAIVAWNNVQRGFRVFCIHFHQTLLIVADFVEQYVPGLPQKISDASVQVWTIVNTQATNAVKFFRTQVFVGQLSPESLGQALNRTSIAATKLNKWFHHRVEDLSKYE